MKVLFHYNVGPLLKNQIQRLAADGINITCCPEDDDDQFFKELIDTDILWHVLRPVDENVIKKAPNLKLIQKIGVGVNTIDLDVAKKKSISVCNMPGTNSRAVAEMTLLLMLATLRKLPTMSRILKSGEWYPDKESEEGLSELCGKTVGFLGFGAVPQILAPILSLMGARIIYSAQSPKEVTYPFVEFDRLLEQSDLLSLHIPLHSSTQGIMNRHTFQMMKPGAILINTARGALVVEYDLYQALLSGTISAAGLDVFASEPILSHHPLFELENVVLTPHVAWLTHETWQRSLVVAMENVLALQNGAALKYRIC